MCQTNFPETMCNVFLSTEYSLYAVTEHCVFYANDEEGDDNANVMCFDKKMNLLSDNIHAANALLGVVLDNEPVEYSSEGFKYYVKMILAEEG